MENIRQPRFFWLAFILLLLIPQISHWILGLIYYHFDFSKIFSQSRLDYFLPNFLIMSFPQLMFGSAVVVKKFRNKFLLRYLSYMAIVAMLFEYYVWFHVPPRESGLFWIVYYPLGAIVLVASSNLLLKKTETTQAVS